MTKVCDRTKSIWLKLFAAVLLVFAVVILMNFPVHAAQEESTAGSSLKNEMQQADGAIKSNAESGEVVNSGIRLFSAVQTGWQKVDDKWYYYDANGVMQTGWQKISGKWYYMNSSGVMQTGWQKINGEWYYLSSIGYWIDDNTYESGSIKGIDVSYYQGDINWNAVMDDGYEFAFLRVGYGTHESSGYTHVVDKKYEEYIEGANEAGMPVGAYIFCYARTVEEAVADADFMIEQMTGHTISYPVVIDVEDSSLKNFGKEQVGAIAAAFCSRIQSAGYTPMVYCNEDWYTNYIDISKISNVDLWVARYNYLYNKTIPRTIWQSTSTGTVAGISGNVDIDFGFKDYTKTIEPRTAPIDNYKNIGTEGYWVQNSVGWWYSYFAGGYPTRCWKQIWGKWYYFDANGYMVTGWQSINGNWYYMNSSGVMQTGWQSINGKWYYMNGGGAMVTGWQEINGKWYYMSSSGAMVTGWQEINGKWYYMSSSGAMQTGWQEINGKWYYMSSSGAMQTGWQSINGKWYYMNSSGAMQTGWQKISGKWYYMNSSGAMQTGWQKISGKWYYMNSSGVMQTGWQKISGKWYYMNSNGAMSSGWQTISGKRYYFSVSGVWVN